MLVDQDSMLDVWDSSEDRVVQLSMLSCPSCHRWVRVTTRGSKWSSTPGRSPGSRRTRSTPPGSHSPVPLDRRPPCTPPHLQPPGSRSSKEQSHSTRLRPGRRQDSPPGQHTWTASHRTGRPGRSGRNSLQRQRPSGQTGEDAVDATV